MAAYSPCRHHPNKLVCDRSPVGGWLGVALGMRKVEGKLARQQASTPSILSRMTKVSPHKSDRMDERLEAGPSPPYVLYISCRQSDSSRSPAQRSSFYFSKFKSKFTTFAKTKEKLSADPFAPRKRTIKFQKDLLKPAAKYW